MRGSPCSVCLFDCVCFFAVQVANQLQQMFSAPHRHRNDILHIYRERLVVIIAIIRRGRLKWYDDTGEWLDDPLPSLTPSLRVGQAVCSSSLVSPSPLCAPPPPSVKPVKTQNRPTLTCCTRCLIIWVTLNQIFNASKKSEWKKKVSGQKIAGRLVINTGKKNNGT